jgi:hypothetical protein
VIASYELRVKDTRCESSLELIAKLLR